MKFPWFRREEKHGHRQGAGADSDRPIEGASFHPAAFSIAYNTQPIAITDPGAGEGAREDVDLPTVTRPLWGFRVWGTGGALRPRLWAVNRDLGPWVPGVNESRCRCSEGYGQLARLGGGRFPGIPQELYNPCPEPPGRACGFWVVTDEDHIPTDSEGRFVVGAVVGWGKTIRAQHGFRCQYASVAALLHPAWNPKFAGESWLPALAMEYNVPLVTNADDLIAEAQKLVDWMAGEDLKDGA